MDTVITEIIRNTYFNRFDEMELEYQLHYASRLYAWSNDETARQKLVQLKSTILPADHEGRVANLRNIRTELANKDYERDVNNYAARKPYFEKYPDLLLTHNALFLIRHWYSIYGVDERSSLFNLVPEQSVAYIAAGLQKDLDAVRVLSTYAINFLYLYEKLSNKTGIVDTDAILRLGARYDHTNKTDIQMLIYLYTHCILGETLFYWRPITRRMETYRRMLAELEMIIAGNFDAVNLDNKFEFLVCARICGFTSQLQTRIYDEAKRSLNDEGFIVDRFNQNINPVKQSFLMSEHRNVLFIMSWSDPKFQNTPITD